MLPANATEAAEALVADAVKAANQQAAQDAAIFGDGNYTGMLQQHPRIYDVHGQAEGCLRVRRAPAVLPVPSLQTQVARWWMPALSMWWAHRRWLLAA